MKLTPNGSADGPRNPFGVQDVPDPDGKDIAQFAETVDLTGTADDQNAQRWFATPVDSGRHSIEGQWATNRWNGGADPTIAGDTKETWKQGLAEVRAIGDRIYMLFTWSDGARRALIDARRDGSQKLLGRYINLSDPNYASLDRVDRRQRTDRRAVDERTTRLS